MEVRINKFLSSAGVCSRREADRLVEEGRVTIDGVTAVCGSKVTDASTVCVDGKAVNAVEEKVLLAFNKPVGVVCTTTDAQGGRNIVDYIGYPVRIFPVGRLDKNSRGLIFMTNQGELSDRILRSRNGHEKEYVVRVDKPVTEEFLKKMAKGVYLDELDRTTNPCKITREGFKSFRIILKQGLNRQIRRMCQACGYQVEDLKRVRIMNVELGELPEGEYRQLSEAEYRELVRELEK